MSLLGELRRALADRIEQPPNDVGALARLVAEVIAAGVSAGRRDGDCPRTVGQAEPEPEPDRSPVGSGEQAAGTSLPNSAEQRPVLEQGRQAKYW